MSDRIISMKDVCKVLNVSKTTLWRLVKAGEFPPARPISPRRKGWSESRVQNWIEERMGKG